jgi:hypothetical protein
MRREVMFKKKKVILHQKSLRRVHESFTSQYSNWAKSKSPHNGGCPSGCGAFFDQYETHSNKEVYAQPHSTH